ncbi:MAG: hypothetical protein IJM76_05760 [Lachnospiraceae bacterium]|nr:hypothetical protein [Lachnospiraceae bacterium]
MIIINGGEVLTPFDDRVVSVDAWYDRHTRLWVIERLNKDGYQIGDAIYVYGKKDAMEIKAELEREIENGEDWRI